jgi:hypothetical protein
MKDKVFVSTFAVVATLFTAAVLMFFLGPRRQQVSPAQQFLSPISNAKIELSDKVPATAIFCVSTLEPTGPFTSMNFCADFHNVHVYNTGKKYLGTGALISYHDANSEYGIVQTYTDFITVYVQTEAERLQYQKGLDAFTRQLYEPRRVPLELKLPKE